MMNDYTNPVKGFALQPYLKAEEGLIYAASNGYDYWYIDGSLNTDIPDNWSEKRIENIKSQMNEFKVKPIFHGNFKVPLASDVKSLRKAAIDYTKEEIDLCEKIDCALIIHGGVLVEPRLILTMKKLALKELVKSLDELQDYAAKKNIKLLLENLSNYPNYRPFTYLATTSEEFMYIMEKTEIPFCFDVGHANVNAIIPVKEFFFSIIKNVEMISVSNNNGKLDQHLSLENGSINHIDFFREILKKNWNGIIAVETRNVLPKKSLLSINSIIELVKHTDPK